MTRGASVSKAKRYEFSVPQCRQGEVRQQVSRALQRWQKACDAWLAVKSRGQNSKDYDAMRQAKSLKSHIDQAADELKQALRMANAA